MSSYRYVVSALRSLYYYRRNGLASVQVVSAGSIAARRICRETYVSSSRRAVIQASAALRFLVKVETGDRGSVAHIARPRRRCEYKTSSPMVGLLDNDWRDWE